MRKKRNRALDYRYNPFLISFISFALIACLALSLLFLFMMYKQSQSFTQDYYRKKATTILDDFQTQLTSLENFSDKLMISKNFISWSPSGLTMAYTHPRLSWEVRSAAGSWKSIFCSPPVRSTEKSHCTKMAH